MKVTVESNLDISGELDVPLEISFEGDAVTTRNVLERLAENCVPFEILKEDGRLGDAVEELFINGKNFFALGRGLDGGIKDGDRIQLTIAVEILAGG